MGLGVKVLQGVSHQSTEVDLILSEGRVEGRATAHLAARSVQTKTGCSLRLLTPGASSAGAKSRMASLRPSRGTSP